MSQLVRDLQELEAERDEYEQEAKTLRKELERWENDYKHLEDDVASMSEYIEWLEAHHPDARKTYDALQKLKESAK